MGYAMDYGGVFFANLCGYDVEYDMKSPWNAVSLRDFWGKRWNQFVASAMRKMVYIPIVQVTESKNIALIAVFFVLGIVHSYPMWLDGFEINICMIVLMWFILQPFCMYVEDVINRTFGYRVYALAFILLFGSLILSLNAVCLVEQNQFI